MDYLHERQYYIDRYDLQTINRCMPYVKAYQTMIKHEHLKKWHTDEDHEFEVNKVISYYLKFVISDRCKDKEKCIEEWITCDTKIQKRYDNTPVPNIKCEHCGKYMSEVIRTFIGSDYETTPLELILSCDDCRNRKRVDQNGNEIMPRSEHCEKCDGIIHSTMKFGKNVTTTTYACTHCGYRHKDIHAHKAFEKEFQEREAKDKALLGQYRDMFCPTGEEAEKLVYAIENMKLGQEIYERELILQDTDAQDQARGVKKIDATELEKILTKELLPLGYKNLVFGQTSIDRYVDIPFAVQLSDSTNKGLSAENLLNTKTKPILEHTNWRLVKDDTRYRLGFLSGKLRGYELEDDIIKLFANNTPKKKLPEIDPERMQKYGHTGWANLASSFAEFELKKRKKLAKLKQFPDGFLLNDEDDHTDYCDLCREKMEMNNRWWNQYGTHCPSCHLNLINKVVPASVMEDRDFFTDKDLKYDRKLRKTELEQFIIDNKLVFHELKDDQGITYIRIFLKDENVEFVKRKQMQRFSPPHVMDDGKGGTYIL